MSEEKIEPVYGPRRKAPLYYAGETYGRSRFRGNRKTIRNRPPRYINHHDVERYPNGAIAGIRNKPARRLIRYALKRRFSSPERGLRLPRAMRAQALEIVKESASIEERNGKTAWKGHSTRAALRLYETELALHQPVWVPSKKEIRAMRTAKRAEKRAKAKANKKMLKGITAP